MTCGAPVVGNGGRCGYDGFETWRGRCYWHDKVAAIERGTLPVAERRTVHALEAFELPDRLGPDELAQIRWLMDIGGMTLELRT